MAKKTCGQKFKKYYPLYRVLHDKKNFGNEMCNAIIKNMQTKHYSGLDEAVDIVLNKNIEMPEKSVQVLKKHANELKKYKLLKKDYKGKKRMLKKHSQKGGFFPLLIPIVTSLAAEGASQIVKAVVNKKKKH